MRSVFRHVVRSIDIIFCAAIVTASFLIPYRKDRRTLAFGLLAFFGVLGIAFLFERRKRKQREEAKRRKTEREIQLEKLMLLSDAEWKEMLNEPDLFVIRKKTLDADSAFSAIRSHAPVVACVGDSDGIERLFSDYAPQTRLLKADELIARLHPSCTDAEIVQRLKTPQKKKIPLRTMLRAATGKKYLLLGFALYALSFLTSYKLYYRLIGSLCFALSAITTVFRSDPSN